MSTIRTLRFHPIGAAVAKPYGMAKGLATARQSTIVVIETADGIQGVGEAWGPPAANMANLGLLKGYVEGRDVADIELAFQLIIARHYHFGIQNQLMACLSGIDMAAKDALGKQAGLPLCRLIGGRGADRVPVYASGGYITEDADKDFAPQIELIKTGGHRAAKIKIGISPASDEKRVKLARDDQLKGELDIGDVATFDITLEQAEVRHVGRRRTPGFADTLNAVRSLDHDDRRLTCRRQSLRHAVWLRDGGAYRMEAQSLDDRHVHPSCDGS